MTPHPCLQPPQGKAAEAAHAYRAVLPKYETERLMLRAARMEDYAVWRELFLEEEGGFLGGPHEDEDIWYAFAAYSAGWLLYGHGLMAVADKTTDTALGFVFLGLEWEDQEPELGWLFPKRCHGKGYAIEAARALHAPASALLGKGKFVSYIHPENHRSAHLAKKLGAMRDAPAEAALGQGHVWRHNELPKGARQ